MARYSRVRGPASNFEMVFAFTLLPGFSITRTFGRGPLLIGGHIRMDDNSASSIFGVVRIQFDGVDIVGVAAPTCALSPNDAQTMPFFYFQPPAPGRHTVEVFVRGADTVGDIVLANACDFFVIELPSWDDDVDFVTL